MTRRPTLLSSPALLLALTVLAACGGNAPEGPAADAAAPSDAATPETTASQDTAAQDTAALTDEELRSRAETLAQETLIVDTHVDVPYRLLEEWEDISQSAGGHFDYPRAKAGGLNAPFMSIYVPAEMQPPAGGAKEHADKLIDMVEKFAADWPDKFAVATSPDDVEAQQDAGLISLPMGMENGAPIEGDLENLRHFFNRGIRYVTLTHGKVNHLADSSYDEERKWHGLSDFGREAVAEMNRLGVMVDVSHVSDEAFDDVIEVTKAPVIASHSSCRHFTPGFERNMDDDMIRKLAENGGVIQINFGSGFLSGEAREASDAAWKAARTFAEENGIADRSDPRAREFWRQYLEEHPPVAGDVELVADHIDHVVQLVGVDHVGLGSDFDGVTSLPDGLKDVSQYPNLFFHLLKRGHSEDDVRKIAGGNLMRVWRRVEAVAAELQAGG